MRNPHLLRDDWNKSINAHKADPPRVSVPGITKKFKRKSREPKRLYNSTSDSVGLKAFTMDKESDKTQELQCGIGSLALAHRQSITSPRGILTGLLEGNPTTTVPISQSHAIDMRIGSNIPAITAKLSQLPVSQFPLLQTSHWPSAVSQLQSSSHKPAPPSMFPSVTAHNSTLKHPSIHQPHSYPQDGSLSGQLVGNQAQGETSEALSLPGMSQTLRNRHTVDPESESPKELPRKRVSGRLPEIKALQQTRRLLANARERTRVHTISAAFEALRKQVPCYSYGQKLSKLAILRIACNYILSLAQLAEMDYSPDHSSRTFSQCVEQCTRTLQAEGRSKKRKE